MPKLLVLYYSSYGHIETMAHAVAEGAREAATTVMIKRVQELVPEESARRHGFKLDQSTPIAQPADHDRALQRVMPTVAECGLGIVVGGPYSFGALVGANFEYIPAPQAVVAKVARIKAIADQPRVSMKAAGLQFALANPAVVAVIPGASQPSHIAEDRAALNEPITAEFWRLLRREGFVHPAAPLPIDA